MACLESETFCVLPVDTNQLFVYMCVFLCNLNYDKMSRSCVLNEFSIIIHFSSVHHRIPKFTHKVC